MKVIVIADVDMQKEVESKGFPEGVEIHFETSPSNAASNADAYFYLLPETELNAGLNWIEKTGAIVFVNAVSTTLSNLPQNAVRINGWRGFIQRSIQEISCSVVNETSVKQILDQMQWHYHLIPDVEGMIAPKVLAMIINEAFFALGDDVSTKEEIDTAMKLGTNYPNGPFEWCEKIGSQNIYNLLVALSKNNNRYTPAPLLIKHATA